MKILVCNGLPDTGPMFGIAQELVTRGNDCILWNPSKKNMWDAFDEFKPDILVTDIMPDKFKKPLDEYINTKVVCVTNDDWSSKFDDLYNDVKTIPYVEAGNKHIATRAVNNKKTGDIVFYGPRNELTESFIYPLLDIRLNLKLKIFSRDSWPTSLYCGDIKSTNLYNITNKASISLYIDTEVREHLFNLCLSNCFVITNVPYSPLMDVIQVVKNYEELLHMVKYYNKYLFETQIMVNKAFDMVSNNELYSHRLKDIEWFQ